MNIGQSMCNLARILKISKLFASKFNHLDIAEVGSLKGRFKMEVTITLALLNMTLDFLTHYTVELAHKLQTTLYFMEVLL